MSLWSSWMTKRKTCALCDSIPRNPRILGHATCRPQQCWEYHGGKPALATPSKKLNVGVGMERCRDPKTTALATTARLRCPVGALPVFALALPFRRAGAALSARFSLSYHSNAHKMTFEGGAEVMYKESASCPSLRKERKRGEERKHIENERGWATGSATADALTKADILLRAKLRPPDTTRSNVIAPGEFPPRPRHTTLLGNAACDV